MRLSGPATIGFLSETVRQNSKPRSFLIWAQGIGAAVAVVLGGDGGQRVRLVAVALEVGLGDVPEDAGEAALDLALLLEIGGLQQGLADRGARQLGHLLDADHEHEARLARPAIDFRPSMDRGRAGGAGVLDAGRGLEAEGGDRPAGRASS